MAGNGFPFQVRPRRAGCVSSDWEDNPLERWANFVPYLDIFRSAHLIGSGLGPEKVRHSA